MSPAQPCCTALPQEKPHGKVSCPILALTPWKGAGDKKNRQRLQVPHSLCHFPRLCFGSASSEEKWLRNPFVSCLCCPTTHCSSPFPRALPELCPGTQGTGCQERLPVPLPLTEGRSGGSRHSSASSPEKVPRGKRKREKSSIFFFPQQGKKMPSHLVKRNKRRAKRGVKVAKEWLILLHAPGRKAV